MPESLAVEFRNVSRRYGAVQANDRISFKVTQGEIHGLIGENGAGKSTAMKMLFGLDRSDEGEIFLLGQQVRFRSSSEAINSGLGMVHQHFMLSEAETALENFLLMRGGQKLFGILDRKRELKHAQDLSTQFGFAIPWEKKVRDLSVGEQQRLEILKALSRKGKVLILDEPTAVLTPQETHDLFIKLRELKSQGYTIILITHKLKEILEITDSLTVFRKGKVVASVKTSATSVAELAELMIGRKIHFEKRPVNHAAFEDVSRLSIQNLKAYSDSAKIDLKELQVRSGEIVGIAGVEGNGQKELIEALVHPKSFKSCSGTIKLLGKETLDWSTHQIRELPISVFPEDRLRVGALPTLSMSENFILGYQRKPQFGGLVLNWKKISAISQEEIEKFQVTPADARLGFSAFSGGNQQKGVVARELFHEPQLILASQPTRGVDIGAIELIHEQLIQRQEKGSGVLLISSEPDELMKLSDRIYVLYRGQIKAHFVRSQFDEKAIGAAMGGA